MANRANVVENLCGSAVNRTDADDTTPNRCSGSMAVDDNGNALSYNGHAWSAPTNIDGKNALASVSCPSASFCMAVDNNGNALSYSTSTGTGTGTGTGGTGGTGGGTSLGPTQVSTQAGGGGTQTAHVAKLTVIAPKRFEASKRKLLLVISSTAAGTAKATISNRSQMLASWSYQVNAAKKYACWLNAAKLLKPGTYTITIKFKAKGAHSQTSKTIKLTVHS